MCFLSPEFCQTIFKDFDRPACEDCTALDILCQEINKIDSGAYTDKDLLKSSLSKLKKVYKSDNENNAVSNFICPVLNIRIQSNCVVSSCKYFVKHPWSKNCLLDYLGHHALSTLSVDEISFLYQMPVDDIKKIVGNAMLKLRYNISTPNFTFIENTNVCCVCESVTEEPIPAIEGLCYCSEDCKAEKPPHVIEQEFLLGRNFDLPPTDDI